MCVLQAAACVCCMTVYEEVSLAHQAVPGSVCNESNLHHAQLCSISYWQIHFQASCHATYLGIVYCTVWPTTLRGVSTGLSARLARLPRLNTMAF